ncbi:MAG: DUF87 domain-containing protein [Lactobacillaceae bacterium]|jgi:DNA segregation ATPase FtsK/SpoIIIE-like protein|nr:DUF87 domain-containing protein [Lactobacillaceae bacterium]
MAKKKQNTSIDYVLISTISFVLVLFLGIFQLGFLGKIIASLLKYIFGNFYYIFASGIIAFIFYLLYKKTLPKIENRYLIGISAIVVALLIILSMLMQNEINSSDLISTLGKNINSDIAKRAVSTNAGGGIIGVILYVFISKLISNVGVIIFSIVLAIFGITTLMGKSFFELLKNAFNNLIKTSEKARKKIAAKTSDNEKNNIGKSYQISENIAIAPSKQENSSLQIHRYDDNNNTQTNNNFNTTNLQTKEQAFSTQAAFKKNEPNHSSFEDWFDIDAKGKQSSIVALPKKSNTVNVPIMQQSSGNNNNNVLNNGNEIKNNNYKIDSKINDNDTSVFEDQNKTLDAEVSFGAREDTRILSNDLNTLDKTEVIKFEEKNHSKATPKLNDYKSYVLPPVTILEKIPPVDQSSEFNQLGQKAKLVQETLKTFKIDTEVSNANLGPTVTQFELKPSAGVKVATITRRADDLALALAAKSIRIEAPIPGRPFVGIEVPNKIQQIVSFENVITNSTADKKHPLSIPLGRDVSGNIVSADLAAMPHLLVAGSTGTGKSVAINSIITGLLMRLKPDELKLLMVDPKRVELSIYNDIPHLITPVVSEPKKAARALQKSVKEMEDRYDMFASNGVRNIEEWNQKVSEYNQKKGQAMVKMPYMVVIVDELADLMMTAKNDVETAIIRIAQMGRAAGIHLILATQRPSVDIITGLIKANVPSRIAFAVSSQMDSRVILDQGGAENLLGKGDMLFAPIGKEPIRVQGSFIPTKDVENVTNFIKNQAGADYDEAMNADINESTDDASNGTNTNDQRDALFFEAREFVIKQKKASSSLLQRNFRIGYGRAARIIDELEAAGVVGPQDGQRPREVLVQE